MGHAACQLAGPQGLLDRVQRHTVEQIIEIFVPVQVLDDPEPLMVERLADILRILDVPPNFVQAFDMPKISQDSIPQRAVLSHSWRNSWWKCRLSCLFPLSSSSLSNKTLTFQLVVCCSLVAMDTYDARVLVPLGCIIGGLALLTPSGTIQGNTPPAQGGTQILGKDDDVAVITQHKFQQFFETVEVPQLQFLDRLLDIPVVLQRQVLTVQTVQKTRTSTGAFLG